MKKNLQGQGLAVGAYLVFAAAVGINMYVTLSAILPPGGWFGWVFWGLYTLLCLLFPAGHVLPRSRPAKWMGMMGNYWTAVQMLLFFETLLVGVLFLLFVPLLRWLTARQFAWASLALLCILAAMCLYGVVHGRRTRVKRYTLAVRKRAAGLRSLRVVHLSDLHLGTVNDLRLMQKILDQVAALAPDIVCITGDTFTENVRQVYDKPAIEAAFRAVPAKYGVYACLGNHDDGGEFPEMLTFFKNAGIRLLRDEAVLIADAVALAGRDDLTPGGHYNEHRPSIATCLQGIAPGMPVILMDHQPAQSQIEEARRDGVELMLCGHTHGGQFVPVQLLVRKVFPHYKGWRQYGDTNVVVSMGSGTAVPPLRIGSDAEIIEITLTFEP